MEHHRILRLPSVRGLTTILPVGGLGVGDKQNGLRNVPIIHHVIYFCRLGHKTTSKNQNEAHFMNRINKFEVHLPVDPLQF